MLISFAEIVKGRNASIQVTKDELLAAVELTTIVCGSVNNKASARTLLNLMRKNIFPASKFEVITTPGSGNFEKRFVTLQNAIELIMVLPGGNAKQVRKKFAEIIVRYLDGDRSMCTEIKANKAMGKLKSYSKFASGVMKCIDNDDDRHANEMPVNCYVYATKSAAFPGLIKIGKTDDVVKRLSQLKTATAPAPHVIVAVAPTFDKDRDEKTAHAFFAQYRREGEFFEISEAAVASYFATHITAQYNTELAQHIAALQGMRL